MVATTWRWNRGLNPTGSGLIQSGVGQLPPSVKAGIEHEPAHVIEQPTKPQAGRRSTLRDRIAQSIIPR